MTEPGFRRRWVRAALILSADSDAEVICPECGQGVLEVGDIESGMADGLIERVIRCPSCGARNAIRQRGRRSSRSE